MLPNTDAATRLARLEQLIDQYREEKRRQLLQRALKLWRKTEADLRLATLELRPERVH
jgi:cobalamin biosynthesis Mg chelatase CobN